MICSKCGAQLPDDAKFCGACGNNVATSNATAVPSKPTTEETINTSTLDTTETVQTETVVSDVPDAASTENTAKEAADTAQTIDNSIPEAAAPTQTTESPASDTINSNPQPTGYTTTQQQDTPSFNTYNPIPQPNPQNSSSNSGYGQAPNFSNPMPDSDGNAGKKGLIMLGAIAVAAIVVIVLFFNLIFGGNSWKSVIKDRIKYLNSQDDDIKDYYIITYGEICGEFNYEQDKLIAELTDNDDWEDDVLDTIEDTYDSFENLYGEDWDIDYEIKSKKALSDSKLDDAADSWEEAVEELEDTLDMLEDIEDPEDYNDELDEDDLEDLIKFYEKWIKKLEDKDVKKGYKVKYKLTIEGDDDDSSNTNTTNIVKIGGDWVEDSFYFSYPSIY